jgi:hypothetical protein
MNTTNAHAGHGEAHRAEALQQEVHVELLRLAHKLGGGEQDGQQLHGVEGDDEHGLVRRHLLVVLEEAAGAGVVDREVPGGGGRCWWSIIIIVFWIFTLLLVVVLLLRPTA